MSGQSFDDSDQLGRRSASPPCSPNQWPLPPTSEARVAAGQARRPFPVGQGRAARLSGGRGEAELVVVAAGERAGAGRRRRAGGRES
jgi:hypothetical protein